MKTAITIAPIPTEPQIFESELRTIEVSGNQEEILDSAGYGYINEHIKRATLINNPGTRPVAIWHRNRSISSKDGVDEISRMTVVIDGKTFKGRPATILELAAHETAYHQDIGDMIIVALAEKVRGDSAHYVAYRGVDGSERGLSLDSWSGDWLSRCSFLVVFDETLETK